MNIRDLLNRKRITAIDIGSYAVKLASLGGSEKAKKLNALALETISPEVIVDGAIMNSDAVAQAVMDMMLLYKRVPRLVGTSLGGSSVIIKQVPMAKMTADDLQRNLEENVTEHIPFPLDEVNVDFHIIKDDPAAPDRMIVFLIASKKDMINDYTGVLMESRLKPMILDVDTFAVGNCFAFNYPELHEEPIALVNIGAAVTNVNIVQHGASLFVRDITKGGYQVTEEIQKTLGASFEEAEIFKKGGEKDSDELIPEEVGSIIRDASQAIAEDIQRSVDFYTQMTSGEEPMKIFISGGMSLVSGMDRIIEDRIGLPVELMNPFKRIEPGNSDIDLDLMENSGALFAVAVGLALREVGDE